MSVPRTCRRSARISPAPAPEADQPRGPHPPRGCGLRGGEREVAVDLRRGIRRLGPLAGQRRVRRVQLRDTARAMNRRLVRSVRRVTPVRPGACAVNRSITDGCSSTSGTGSRPSPIP